MNTKYCGKCKNNLSIEDFGKDRYSLDMLTNNCKKCRYQMTQKWFSENPEKVKVYRKNSYLRNREKVIEKRNIYVSKNIDIIREKQKIYERKRRKENFKDVYEKGLKSELHLKYKISINDYNNMLKAQDNRCAICKEFETTKNHSKNSPIKTKRLSIDHCHISGNVRGLLCHKCNSGLGNFRDNIKYLEEAIKYLS